MRASHRRGPHGHTSHGRASHRHVPYRRVWACISWECISRACRYVYYPLRGQYLVPPRRSLDGKASSFCRTALLYIVCEFQACNSDKLQIFLHFTIVKSLTEVCAVHLTI